AAPHLVLPSLLCAAHLLAEYGAALRACGHKHCKQIFKAPAAEKLRRQLAYVVGSGKDKTASFILLHPGKQPAKHALEGPAPVAARSGGRRAETLIQLVYPQYAGRHGFGLPECGAHIALGIPNVPAHKLIYAELQ